MTFKSIATYIQNSEGDQQALEFAIDAARKWGAHLHVVAAGINSIDPGYYYAGAPIVAAQQNLINAQGTAREIEKVVRDRLEAEDINWDVETVTLLTSSIEHFLLDHMRFFDVAILPLPYSPNCSHLDVIAFEACLFGAGIPIILVPTDKRSEIPSSRIMIAWDNGSEALAASRAALPIATEVELSEICVIDPSRFGSDRSDPGGRVAQMLARSGARVEITVAAKMHSDVTMQLLQRANETGAEMIVMGAYGHSKLHQAVLGGVTRSMLKNANLPLLLAN